MGHSSTQENYLHFSNSCFDSFPVGLFGCNLSNESSHSWWVYGSPCLVGPVLYSKNFLKGGFLKSKKIEFYKKREVYTFDIDKNFKNLSLKNFKKKNYYLLYIIFIVWFWNPFISRVYGTLAVGFPTGKVFWRWIFPQVKYFGGALFYFAKVF